jgi:AcrR family transcriptional regulator
LITGGDRNGDVSTRDRIVTAAIRLFAERGYLGTTVGDIEQAAGLSPRAGGLYKHFPSKEAVLEAGIERHVSELEAIRPTLETLPLDDLRTSLRVVARWTLDELADEMPLMKIVQKDGDRFPELVAEVHGRIVARGHSEAAQLVERIMGGTDGGRAAALGSVALGALVNYRIEETMFGAPPNGLSEDDYIETWVEVVLAQVEAARRNASRRGS